MVEAVSGGSCFSSSSVCRGHWLQSASPLHLSAIWVETHRYVNSVLDAVPNPAATSIEEPAELLHFQQVTIWLLLRSC